jgi:chromosome segregation ATPase
MENAQRFLKHLSLAYKRIQESDALRQDLKEHIQVIRDLSSSKQCRPSDIQSALKELEEKIEEALSRQTKVIQSVSDEQSFNAQLLRRITSVEKHIENYVKTQQRRQERIRELELKIRRRAKRKS